MVSKDSVQRFRYLYFIHTDQRLLSTLLCGNVYNLNRIEYIKKTLKWFDFLLPKFELTVTLACAYIAASFIH